MLLLPRRRARPNCFGELGIIRSVSDFNFPVPLEAAVQIARPARPQYIPVTDDCVAAPKSAAPGQLRSSHSLSSAPGTGITLQKLSAKYTQVAGGTAADLGICFPFSTENRGAQKMTNWTSVAVRLGVVFFASQLCQQSVAQSAGTREVPARVIPVPDTVSPQLQAMIGRQLDPKFNIAPETTAEWKKRVDDAAAATVRGLPRLREALGVTVEPTSIAGVRAFIVTAKSPRPGNRDRILLHLHGGIRVLNPGESGTREAILMAGLTGFKVISVDYRMPPDFPFPAALDDAVAVYREMLKTAKPENIGIFGTSAGGSLTLTTLLRAKMENLPMPGAIAPGTPTVDLSKTGDTLFTNAGVDNVLGTQDGFIRATALLYANGRDLKDPLLSPIYGDVHGFPPAILTSGTRDLYLSNTVRMHRKLRAAGVEAVLQVWEGQSHANYMAGDEGVPEVREYHEEVARFFDQHLGR
jgi:epsilon-lactone hydrolase